MSWIRRFWPKSLVGRLASVLVLAIAAVQLISSVIWMTQARFAEEQEVSRMAEHMALSMASTVKFFNSLPVKYRHIVLDQLRNMGGSRFFVSINKELILINDYPEKRIHHIVISEFNKVLRKELGKNQRIIVKFSDPDTLHVFNNDVLLTDLPPRWTHHSLLMKPLSPPILVTQIQVAENEWLYVAALIPHPSFISEREFLSTERLIFLGLMLVVLLLVSFWVVTWLAKPLERLSKAAEELGRDLEQPPLPEEGSQEMVKAAKAFNAMQYRLQRYIDDRARLFATISHDLKTPITRMRLRAEMLADDMQRERFCQDLADLDLMVKGALQCVKDTDIHENQVPIDIMAMLRRLKDDASMAGHEVSLIGNNCKMFIGKPLAIKRALTNLLDNAIAYGKRAEVSIIDSPQKLVITIRDFGPGLQQGDLEKVFEPYYRSQGNVSKSGIRGLGLGIVRSIARAHGGEIILNNHPEGGLIAELTLPRQ